jgi:NTE family protein
MRTAFVLSGGASLGSIQVGMLEALYERNIRPDLIVGTSVGALNGAFIAERPQDVDTARELGEVWRGLKRRHVFPVNPVTGALGLSGARSHLVSDSGLRRLVRRHAMAQRLEDTLVPLHVIATDVFRGGDFRLSKGPLVDAVMASAAIPGVFPAVDWHGRTLVDGGVANNAPISHALDLGADEIYVLPTGSPCELHALPRGALAMLVYATGLLLGSRLTQEIAALAGQADITVLPAPCPLSVLPTDFGHADMLIAQARAGAREFLDGRRHARRLPPRPTSEDLRDWRMRRLRSAGFSSALATRLGADCGVDLKAVLELVDRGCPPDVAARIVAPLHDGPIVAE